MILKKTDFLLGSRKSGRINVIYRISQTQGDDIETENGAFRKRRRREEEEEEEMREKDREKNGGGC